MSCQIDQSGQSLRVCFTADTAFYRFGPPKGEPDLEISQPLGFLDYQPWPGVGRSIFETVVFSNEGYDYTVFAGFDRMFGDETEKDHPSPRFGGVTVTRGEEELAALTCSRQTVDFAWGEGLFEAKQNLGYVWDFDSRSWIALPD
ncbi:hypothetical protein [Pseudooctadecabacter sp.]|uniref:hypothetical protein n=1 Tax=Pseudooctadecabacter sp. TaxID=1966338 RepID=UPI0035C7F7DE